MTIKARLLVNSVEAFGEKHYQKQTGEKQSEKVSMHAVYSDDKSDPNYSYSQATPGASVELWVSNKDAWGFFKPGYVYDLTFEQTAKEDE